MLGSDFITHNKSFAFFCVSTGEMVHHQRYHQLRKGEDDEEAQSLVDECGSAGYYKRTRPKLLALLFLSLLSCCFVLAPCLFSFPICEPFFLSFFFFFHGFPLFSLFFVCFFCLISRFMFWVLQIHLENMMALLLKWMRKPFVLQSQMVNLLFCFLGWFI